MDINSKLKEIILLLEEDKFVEVHYMFEDLWKEYKKHEDTREESFILKAFRTLFLYFIKGAPSSLFDILISWKPQAAPIPVPIAFEAASLAAQNPAAVSGFFTSSISFGFKNFS